MRKRILIKNRGSSQKMDEKRCHCSLPFARLPQGPLSDGEASLIKALLAGISCPEEVIDEVVVGPKQVLVRSGDRAGIATTLGSSDQKVLSEAGSVKGGTLKEAASLLYDDLLLNRSLGAAALNAALEAVADEESPNALELILREGRGRHVAVVGDFPFTARIAEVAGQFSLLELKDRPGCLPPHRWDEALRSCDVAAITGTALLTRSMDRYLSLSSEAYQVVLGATAPLSPVLLDRYGVDVIAGSIVADIEGVRAGILEGWSIAALHRAGCLRFCNRTGHRPPL